MAKSQRIEMMWLECTECGERNYRTPINVREVGTKLQLKKFCPKSRTHTMHKVRRK